MKKAIKLISLLLAFSMIFALAGCGKNPSDTNGTTAPSANEDNGNLKKITFALDWTPNTNHTGLFVAKEKGYFKEAGLDVDIVFIDGETTAQLCAANKAQFAIECQDTMAPAFMTEEPVGITAVAAILQHNTSGIISRKGDGITSPKGLEGKTYSTWDSPIELAILKSLTEKESGDFSKVNLITNNITDEPGALDAKQTDAIWVFYGWGCINAQIRNFDFDYFFIKDLNPVFDYYTPVIIASNDFLKNDPETAKAFLKAAKKGYEYAVKNPDESAEILINTDNTGSLRDSEELVKQSQRWISEQYIADAEKWGYIDPQRWDGFYDWLNDNGLTGKTIPHGTGFTNDYLE